MSKDENAGQKAPSITKAPVVAQRPVAEGPSKCQFVDCKHKPEKFGFCMEHYEMYMAGVIRGDGKKPVDFEIKFASYQQQQKHKKVA